MSTNRTEVMAALELAALVLPAVDSAANHRDAFVSLIGLDPALVGRGQGRRAARILSAVLVALRERDGTPSAAAGRGINVDHRAEPDDQAGIGDEHGIALRSRHHEAHGAHLPVRHPL
jgi:hypothetical protein